MIQDQILHIDYDENLYMAMCCGIFIMIFTSILYKYNISNIHNIKLTNLNKTCVVSNNMYPEINDIIMQKSVILDELTEIIKSGIWSHWSNRPERDNTNVEKDKKWKIYNLILERQIINHNISMCPETYNIIKDISGLINASFSCLEPHCIIPYHGDSDTRFYRIHIPIIVPISATFDDLGMIIKDKKNNRLSWSTDYFVFNNTCEHKAFNNTDYHQIILLLDIERR